MSESTYLIPIECKGDTADVLIYDQIGNSFFAEGVTAKAFAEQLRQHKGVKNINVRINSPGGNVFDATAIFNTLRNHGAKVTTHVEGAALSAASLIAMAGDEIRMAEGSWMMIHDPMGAARGKSEDMRKQADMLDRVKASLVATYATRTKQPSDEIARMMSAETWLSPENAKEKGFADVIAGVAPTVAAFDPNQFSNVPQELRVSLVSSTEKPPMATPETPKAATLPELKAACTNADAAFLLAQLEAGATVQAASSAWMTELQNKVTALTAANAEALEKAKKAPPAPAPVATGVEPLPTGNAPKNGGTGTGGDPVAEFQEAVEVEMKHGKPRHAATAIVCRKNPELRDAMVAAHNAAHKPARR
jgi:ATP-dependent Clp protease protease subunit